MGHLNDINLVGMKEIKTNKISKVEIPEGSPGDRFHGYI